MVGSEMKYRRNAQQNISLIVFALGKKKRHTAQVGMNLNLEETYSSSPTLEENVKRSNDQLAFPGRYGVIVKKLFHKSEEKMI